MDGKYSRKIWSGQLRATDIDDGRRTQETFAMPEPASFLIARDRVELGKLCIALGRGQFCADGTWQRNGPWQATVSGYEIPLALVLPPGSTEAEYGGRIEGRIHASGRPGTPWLLDAGGRIIDASIIYRPPGAQPETLNLGNGGLSATATAERINFSLGVQAFEDTFLYANAHIERNGGNDLLHLPLTGNIRARAADANILPLVFSEIDNAAGLLTANVDVSGTLAAPEVTGRIELANGAFDSYRVNLALRQINLVADLANTGVNFHGSGAAGDGRLSVNGKFTWQQRKLHGDLDLQGENLLVADLPEYHVIASPDLHFRIDDRQVNVAGDVRIPSARIQPVNLSGAVQASEDARYVGETEAERAGRMSVRSEVRIQMGDDVRVDAFGLQGQIVGGVGTTIITGETPIGRGELSVKEGRYEAYGQKLDITRGRLLFDASPLEDPGLDIEAQRKIESIKVGMNVRGTLKSPRLSFFSDPSMPQTQIMSYLLVGKGIDSMQDSDAATVGSASDALTVQGGGFLASQLGRRLGIEEVGVESSRTAAGETNTSLVLGKFLSPRLFISYGISLTESINPFKLRYTISDRWLVKVEAGEVQSGDLEYTIER
jgi:translocation and assembly module TamB